MAGLCCKRTSQQLGNIYYEPVSGMDRLGMGCSFDLVLHEGGGVMRNMGIPRRQHRDDRIDWAALIVVIGCGLAIIVGLSVIAKYVFG